MCYFITLERPQVVIMRLCRTGLMLSGHGFSPHGGEHKHVTFPDFSSRSVASCRYICFESGPAVKNVARRRVAATTMLAQMSCTPLSEGDII